jgi:hypothetical protein
MSALSKGGGGPASSDVQGSETRGEASGPMASQFQFSTLGFRGSRQQNRKEQQAHTTGPVSPKKRKVDIDAAFSAHDDISTLLQEIKSATAQAVRVTTGLSAAAGFWQDMQSLRSEMEDIKKGQLQITNLMNAVTVASGRQGRRQGKARLR